MKILLSLIIMLSMMISCNVGEEEIEDAKQKYDIEITQEV